MKHFRLIHWFYVAILIIWAIFIVSATHAPAYGETYLRWVKRYHCDPYYNFCNWVWRRERAYRAPVYGYVRRDEDRYRDRRECKDEMTEHGGTHATEAGALKDAERRWADAVRFEYGERWMMLELAEDVRHVCTRSSAPEGVITGAIVQATGGEKRCKIVARPCKAILERTQEGR